MTRPIGPLRIIDALSRNPSIRQVSLSISIEELSQALNLGDLTTQGDKNSLEITETKLTQKFQGDEISHLTSLVDKHYSELSLRLDDLEGKWNCIVHLIQAIHYLYQYWDYFLAFRTACECKTYLDIANMDVDKAHRIMIDYNRKEKCIHGSVTKDVIRSCISTAKELTAMSASVN